MNDIKVYQKPAKKRIDLATADVSLAKQIVIDYFVHNIENNDLNELIGENFETIILVDFYKGLGVLSHDITAIVLDILNNKLEEFYPPDGHLDPKKEFIGSFLELIIKETVSESDKGVGYAIKDLTEGQYPDNGSLLLEQIIDRIVEPAYHKYLKKCESITDIKAILALQTINDYLSKNGLEKQFSLDSNSGNFRQFILMLNEQDGSLYKLAYEYFESNNSELAELALIKGLKLKTSNPNFFKMTNKRIKNLIDQEKFDEAVSFYNSVTDSNVLSPECFVTLLETIIPVYNSRQDFPKIAKAYGSLINKKPNELRYWEGCYNAICNLYKHIHDKPDYKPSANRFVLFDITKMLHNNYNELISVNDPETKRIIPELQNMLYDMIMMGGSIYYEDGKDHYAMHRYSDAIKVEPKRNEAWDYKISILRNRNSIYYDPSESRLKKLMALKVEAQNS